ncbi:MAG: gliding motility-associated C-terminal domain-containing protein [Bacteroidetes bacterium]|nr:gliding motility-associated C-terminal domain-containing protein [Bacteroidota bacterium]
MKKIYSLTIAFLCLLGSTELSAQGADCSTATQLTNVINYCSGPGAYTNVGATASGFGLPTCWNAGTPTEDVWFQFTAIGTDALISVGGSGAGGTMVRPRIAIYNGNCGGTINELGCVQAANGSGVAQLYEGAMIPGTIYYIRVSTTNAQEGTFELCINNYSPSANPGADCGGAAFLCNQNPVSVGTLSGGGANNDEPESSSCMEDAFGADEGNSSWFYWTCGVSGTLTVDLTPINPNDDIDFIVYQLSAPNVCGTRSILRCNTSACLNANGSTGLSLTDTDLTEDPGCDFGENAYCQFVNMVAGTSYAILVNNFSANSGFTMNFGGTGLFQGPNPNISTSATTICAGGSVSFDGTSSTNVSGGLSWNFLNGGSPTSATGVGPHSVTYANQGSYVAILNGIDATGCQATEVANITVGPPAASPTVANVNYCQGQTASVLTATGTNLLWYTSATGGVGSATAPTPSTATVGTTSYFVSQTPSGCESPRAQIDVVVSAGPDATATTPVNLNCVPATITLSGSSTATSPSYSWAGPSIVSGANTATPSVGGAGTYTLTVTSGVCTNTTTVVVNPPTGSPQLTFSGDNDTLTCLITAVNLTSSSTTSNVSFQWTGPTVGNVVSSTANATVNAPGTYTITVTDGSNGCTSVNSFAVATNTAVPTIAPVSNHIITCTTTTATLSTTAVAGITYAWTGPTVGNPAGTTPLSNSTVVSASGTYTVTAINSTNGCTNTATGTVTTNTAVPSVTMGSNQSITCAANTVTINGTGNSNAGGSVAYSWTGPSVGSPAGTSPSSSLTNVSSAGTYTLLVTDQTNGCTISGTLSVTASIGVPSITATANDTISCNTNSVQLMSTTSTNAVHYAWTDPAGNPVGTTSGITASAIGTYTLTVTDTTNNCVSSVQVAVVADLASPIVTVGPNPLLSCSVTSVNLTASSNVTNATYSWTGPTSGTPAGNNPTNDTTNVATAGNYTVTVVNPTNGCSSNATVLVNSNGSQTIVNAGPATTTLPCGSTGITLSGTQLQTGYQYVWTNSVGTVLNPSGGSTAPGVNTPGTYYLTATNPATGCSSVDSIRVIPGVQPNAAFSPSVNSGYLPLPVVYTNTSTGANNYQWFVSGTNGLPVAYSANYANTFSAAGTYTVILVAGNGSVTCNDTAFTIIVVQEPATVLIPNIFSPNGDNINDVLKPITTGMKSLMIDIYNRWGTKMITFDGLTTGWAGDGNSEGTYFYIAKGVGEDGTEIEEKGYILMVK